MLDQRPKHRDRRDRRDRDRERIRNSFVVFCTVCAVFSVLGQYRLQVHRAIEKARCVLLLPIESELGSWGTEYKPHVTMLFEWPKKKELCAAVPFALVSSLLTKIALLKLLYGHFFSPLHTVCTLGLPDKFFWLFDFVLYFRLSWWYLVGSFSVCSFELDHF